MTSKIDLLHKICIHLLYNKYSKPEKGNVLLFGLGYNGWVYQICSSCYLWIFVQITCYLIGNLKWQDQEIKKYCLGIWRIVSKKYKRGNQKTILKTLLSSDLQIFLNRKH